MRLLTWVPLAAAVLAFNYFHEHGLNGLGGLFITLAASLIEARAYVVGRREGRQVGRVDALTATEKAPK